MGKRLPSKSRNSGNLGLNFLLIILILLALGAASFFLFQQYGTRFLQQLSALPQTPNTTNWQTYTNAQAGFRLQYPSSVFLNNTTQSDKQLTLSVSVDKLSDIPEDLPMLMGRNDALNEKARLTKGQGENLVKIGPLYGQVENVLAQFEVCSVLFTRKVTFYPGDYRVIVSLAGPKAPMVAAMPDFFTIDKANCGTQKVWNQGKIGTFLATLEKKMGKGIAQQWYDTFQGIVQTITFTTPINAATNMSTYTNNTYGFTISYPNSYKALDDANNLYGYPHGIVLLYSGGQAYDVVIESWNTQAEYENAYSSRMPDVTVVKSNGKFITLLDNTKSAENKQIIASFKLLSP